MSSGLDASQLLVASAKPQERQIVLAGPGAGKSYVVGALASMLHAGAVALDRRR